MFFFVFCLLHQPSFFSRPKKIEKLREWIAAGRYDVRVTQTFVCACHIDSFVDAQLVSFAPVPLPLDPSIVVRGCDERGRCYDDA